MTILRRDARWLTIREAADHVGLSVDSLYHRVSQRSIPFVKLGKRVMFDRQALDEWLSAASRDAMD